MSNPTHDIAGGLHHATHGTTQIGADVTLSCTSSGSANLGSTCLFCSPEAHGQGDQILLRSDRFFLFAGLGAIVEGYIIITPYRCDDPRNPCRCIADMSADMIDEIMFLRELVAEFYRCEYGTPGLAFEHGRAGACLSSRSDSRHCFHAHLCCYPSSARLADRMKDLDPGPLDIAGIGGLGAVTGGRPYVYSERTRANTEVEDRLNPDREKIEASVALLGEDRALRSQYLRRLLATEVGQPELGDWAEHPTPERVAAVINRFRGWLARTDRYRVEGEPDRPILDFASAAARLNVLAHSVSAGSFHKTHSGRLVTRALGRFLSRFSDNPEKVPAVLDAGCGPGMYTSLFRKIGFDVTAVDASEAMVHVAEASYGGKFLVRDLNNLGPEAGLFDGVWCSAVLVHVPRQRAPRLLAELRRVLKPNGVLYLSAQVGTGIRTHPDGRTFFYYSPQELAGLLTGAGFDIVEMWKGVSRGGTHGSTELKYWRHIIARPAEPQGPRAEPAAPAALPRPKEGEYVFVRTHALEPEAETEVGCPRDAAELGWVAVAASHFGSSASGSLVGGVHLDVDVPWADGVTLRRNLAEGAGAAARSLALPPPGLRFREGPSLQVRAVAHIAPPACPAPTLRAGDRLLLAGTLGVVLAEACIESGMLDDEMPQSVRRTRRPKTPLVAQAAAAWSEAGLAAMLFDLAAAHPRLDFDVDEGELARCVPSWVARLADEGLLDAAGFALLSPDWVALVPQRPGNPSEPRGLAPIGSAREGTGRVWLVRSSGASPVTLPPGPGLERLMAYLRRPIQ